MVKSECLLKRKNMRENKMNIFGTSAFLSKVTDVQRDDIILHENDQTSKQKIAFHGKLCGLCNTDNESTF